jgi:hypothetical protein
MSSVHSDFENVFNLIPAKKSAKIFEKEQKEEKMMC